MRIFSIVTRPDTAPRLPTQDEMERTAALLSELKSDGSLIDADGILPGLLEMKITRREGDYSVLDGPFSEAKEVVGGYLLFEVPDRAAAIAFTPLPRHRWRRDVLPSRARCVSLKRILPATAQRLRRSLAALEPS